MAGEYSRMSGRGGVNGLQDASIDDTARSRTRSEGIYGVPSRRSSSPGPGPDRRASIRDRDSIRAHPYTALPVSDRMNPMRAPVPVAVWEQDFDASGVRSSEEGTKLYLSNLDLGVSNTDIQLLFSEVGDLISYSIHYDRSGRSKGTAEVVFRHQTDALAAIKRFNNVRLDGKPLKIEVVGTPALICSTPAPLPANYGRYAPIHSSENTNPRKTANFASESFQDKVVTRESLVHGGDGNRRGLARNRERQGSLAGRLSFADLDADLENYRSEALRFAHKPAELPF